MRPAVFVAGAAVLLLGILLPDAWYAPVLRADLPVPPVRGIDLLRATLLLSGLATMVVGAVDFGIRRLTDAERAAVPEPPAAGLDPTFVRLCVVAVTVLALALRSIRLGSDLWIDEIVTVTTFARQPVLQIISTYGSSNNHLLNTLLIKFAVLGFGEHEWSVRLPAMIFGTASVPVFYLLARQALDARKSLAAALLLAVSYQHIFFSQNARGYIAYVFFSLFATLAFVCALRSDRARDWFAYLAAVVLAFASLVISAYVLAAHAVVGLIAAYRVRRRRGRVRPLVVRLLLIFAAAGFLCLQLYALLLPQILVFVGKQYSNPADAWRPLSFGFLAEVWNGLAAGLSPPLLAAALVGVPVAALGFARLIRRNWVLSLGLLLPGVFQMIQLQFAGLSVTPRLFLLWLPLAILVFVEGVAMAAATIAQLLHRDRRFTERTMTVMILLATGASLASLSHYYTYAKQPYRASLEYVRAARRPGSIVVVVHLAERGYRYYGPSYGVLDGEGAFFVRSVAALDAVLGANPNAPAVLVTTLNRILRIDLPDLDARITRDWVEDRRFRGTLGDGDVVVWKRRAAGSAE